MLEIHKVLVAARLPLKILLSADTTPDQETDTAEQIPDPLEEVHQEEVYNPSENGDVSVDEEIPLPEDVDEIPVDSDRVAESCAEYEDAPKKSYASIVSSLLLPF